MKTSLLIFLIAGSLLAASPAFAVDATRTPIPSASASAAPGVDLTIQSIYNIIVGIACYLIRISIALMVIAVIFYGIKFLISQGDPGKVEDARKGIGWAVVGILVILGTYTIIKTVSYAVGAGGNISILQCTGI